MISLIPNTNRNVESPPSTLPFLPLASLAMVLIDITSGVQFGRIVYLSCNQLICVYYTAVCVDPFTRKDQIIDRFLVLYPDVLFLRVTAYKTPLLIPEVVTRLPTYHFIYNMMIVGGFEGNSTKLLNDHLFQLSRDPYTPVRTVRFGPSSPSSPSHSSSTDRTNRSTNSRNSNESMPGTSRSYDDPQDPCSSGTSRTLSTPGTSGTNQNQNQNRRTNNNPGTSRANFKK